ncbi:DUF6625 family protein [Chryseobacterium paridis]|uniref:Glycosyl transferase n=1 Tax=Chryseobacterium paridis TaxID=2800328 RepID=A0ABS1FUW1_9FLAO|nr:DUF6625 family protein [Chryseobacterium paridis]MBK1896213.1 hypothetical protein [Chryseobacterium paridis]
MKKIAFINCFFGKTWPDYFDYFLKGCEYNPTIDFYIFTNIAPKYKIKNVHFIKFDLQKFNEMATEKLKISVNVKDAYKLCDFKPLYGEILQEYISKYDFWGYCDVDLMFGNIRAFVTHDMLNEYDVISPVDKYPAGFFTLYRNTPFINKIFRLSKDFKKIVQSDRHFCFDECNFEFNTVQTQDIQYIDSEIESMALLLRKLEISNKIRYFHADMAQEFLHSRNAHIWRDGNIYDLITEKHYLLIHFINIKGLPTFHIEKYTKTEVNKREVFYISPQFLGRDLKRKFNFQLFISPYQKKVRNFMSKTYAIALKRPYAFPFIEDTPYRSANQEIFFYKKSEKSVIMLTSTSTLDNYMYSEIFLYQIKENHYFCWNKIDKIQYFAKFHYLKGEEKAYKIEIEDLNLTERGTMYLMNK